MFLLTIIQLHYFHRSFKHKENEAIQFEIDIDKENCDDVANEMVYFNQKFFNS